MLFRSFSACGKETESSTDDNSLLGGAESIADNNNAESQTDDDTTNDSVEDNEGLNFIMPVKGEEIVVFDIKDYGEIKIKLFPDECPKGVENFKTHVENGYYDGITFHRVIKDFMIQGGDPLGSGMGGESIWGTGFKQEINAGLRHFAGALSYATAQDKLNGSQFFIVTGIPGTALDQDYMDTVEKYYAKGYSDSVIKAYGEKGGYPTLDNDYEVFGQVFEGLEICFEIAETPTNSSDKPMSDVVITKATIEKYE